MNKPTEREMLYRRVVVFTIGMTIMLAAVPLNLAAVATRPWPLYLTGAIYLVTGYAATYVKRHKVLRGKWWLTLCVVAAMWPTLLTAVPTYRHLPHVWFALLTAGFLFVLATLSTTVVWIMERALSQKKGRNNDG